MKMQKLVMLPFVLMALSVTAHAETLVIMATGTEAHLRDDQFLKLCTIDTDGTLEFSREVNGEVVKELPRKISVSRLKTLKKLSDELVAGPVPEANEYQTQSGKSFELAIYPQSNTMLIHAAGESALKHSDKARRLVLVAAATCGLEKEVIQKLFREAFGH